MLPVENEDAAQFQSHMQRKWQAEARANIYIIQEVSREVYK